MSTLPAAHLPALLFPKRIFWPLDHYLVTAVASVHLGAPQGLQTNGGDQSVTPASPLSGPPPDSNPVSEVTASISNTTTSKARLHDLAAHDLATPYQIVLVGLAPS